MCCGDYTVITNTTVHNYNNKAQTYMYVKTQVEGKVSQARHTSHKVTTITNTPYYVHTTYTQMSVNSRHTGAKGQPEFTIVEPMYIHMHVHVHIWLRYTNMARYSEEQSCPLN